jgi:hypothetical protein
MADLEAADLVHAANGVVSVAYPFSGMPTRQQVEFDGFPAVYAMCAIDALGIPAMTGRDGRIAAVDPRDGAPVVVSARGGQWRWTPATAVVVFATNRGCGTDCGSWEVMCPNTTFHASRDSAQAYLAARGDIDGQILDQDAAVERGRRTSARCSAAPYEQEGHRARARRGPPVKCDGFPAPSADPGRQRPGGAVRPRRDRRQPDLGHAGDLAGPLPEISDEIAGQLRRPSRGWMRDDA